MNHKQAEGYLQRAFGDRLQVQGWYFANRHALKRCMIQAYLISGAKFAIEHFKLLLQHVLLPVHGLEH